MQHSDIYKIVKKKEYKYIIWGTGYYAGKILVYLNQLNRCFDYFEFKIEGYIDTDEAKQKKKIDGINVYPVSYLNSVNEDVTLIVSMADNKDAIDYLQRISFDHYVTARDILLRERVASDYISSFSEYYIESCEPVILRNKARLKIRNDISLDGSIHDLCALMGEFNEQFKGVEERFYINDISKGKRFNKHKKVIGIYYSRIYNGGVERVISILIPIYIHMGYHVVLFTHMISNNDYHLPDDVERCVIPFDPFLPYEWLYNFNEELINRKIDVLINHAHAAYRSFYLGLCAKSLGIKYIVESHTCIASVKNKDEDFYKNIYSLADILVVLSKTDMHYWSSVGIKTRYIPNPVILSNYIIDKNYGNYDERTILWVGRIDEVEKRISETIRVLNEVKKSIPNVVLKIVGAADSSEVYDNYIEKVRINNLANNVVFCGYNDDVDEYYKEAAVLIFTSPYEGFPMSIAESRSFGLPAVVYDLVGVELFQDGRGYISVPQGDYKAMSKAIIRVLNDRDFRRRLSIDARESIEDFAKIDLRKLWASVIEQDY